jgi:hypothetical protein
LERLFRRFVIKPFRVAWFDLPIKVKKDEPLKDVPFITDYRYTPKQRDSLKTSKIGEILESWYANNSDEITELVRKFCSFKESYQKIPFDDPSGSSPQWRNSWILPFDAMSIYGFLAIHNPRYYVEVGSGNTTLFAAQSIKDNHLRTKIISIDPYPRAEIDKLCHHVYRMPFEDMDLNFFATLTAEDILLVDNSHRSFPNSDVTVFFTEVLPMLPSGMLYTMHDILLPSDYSAVWSCEERRWYNEQYLLCAYLLGGAGGDKIVCPICFLGGKSEISAICQPLWGQCEMFADFRKPSGGFFWLRKA